MHLPPAFLQPDSLQSYYNHPLQPARLQQIFLGHFYKKRHKSIHMHPTNHSVLSHQYLEWMPDRAPVHLQKHTELTCPPVLPNGRQFRSIEHPERHLCRFAT